jgi:hypothetical protein
LCSAKNCEKQGQQKPESGTGAVQDTGAVQYERYSAVQARYRKARYRTPTFRRGGEWVSFSCSFLAPFLARVSFSCFSRVGVLFLLFFSCFSWCPFLGASFSWCRCPFLGAVVSGTSTGALVGAAYAAGKLDLLEDLARNLNWRRALKLTDFRLHPRDTGHPHFSAQRGTGHPQRGTVSAVQRGTGHLQCTRDTGHPHFSAQRGIGHPQRGTVSAVQRGTSAVPGHPHFGGAESGCPFLGCPFLVSSWVSFSCFFLGCPFLVSSFSCFFLGVLFLFLSWVSFSCFLVFGCPFLGVSWCSGRPHFPRRVQPRRRTDPNRRTGDARSPCRAASIAPRRARYRRGTGAVQGAVQKGAVSV